MQDTAAALGAVPHCILLLHVLQTYQTDRSTALGAVQMVSNPLNGLLELVICLISCAQHAMLLYHMFDLGHAKSCKA